MSKNEVIGLIKGKRFSCVSSILVKPRNRLAESFGFSFLTVTVELVELTAKRLVCELRCAHGMRGRVMLVYGVSNEAG